jgi:alkanesulfonate monooxygenase SsuD/methylene tetrahydromethanopterin reductase-like flavin-dependent oxidoreductase (luciferase family)
VSLTLGVTLPQFADDADRLRSALRAVEQSGLDSVWFFDHLWPLGGDKQKPIMECFTTLAFAASFTERVRIGTLVARSSLRHPVVLAKMAATIASIAPGRLTLAIGSGDRASKAENDAFGLPYWDGEERIDQLRSTVEVVRAFFDPGPVTHRDGFVAVEDLPPSPRPPEPPVLWVGGRAGDTLEIAATADGWNGWGGTPERFAQDAQTVLGFAAGRPLELSWGGQVVLEPTDAAAREAARGKDPDAVAGSPDTVAARLREIHEAGAAHLIVAFGGRWTEERLRVLTEEVRPLLP